MIHSLQIDGYRGFASFSMSGLGRINLLVGTNNSGKTSVLESLYLLVSAGEPSALWRVVNRRGERLDEDIATRQPELILDISHLFHGHQLVPGATISLSTRNESPERSVRFMVQEASAQEVLPGLGTSEREEPLGPRLVLAVDGSPSPAVPLIPLTRRGGLRLDSIESPRRTRKGSSIDGAPVQYISTESLSVEELASMWNKIVLTEAEDRVLRALRFLEPKIERIAAVTVSRYYYHPFATRGGFVVKLSGAEQPVPIGSLGDGIWRTLAMAIALIRSKDGVLLVDEIDTGLHYTVMADMWKLISEAARIFNVQVFATTHSYDCVKSLAAICRADIDTNSAVTIQRIEPLRGSAIPYTESQIKVAAEREIEIR